MTQRHELVDECLAPVQCACAVMEFDLTGVNTKYMQYRLTLEALRIAEEERTRQRKRTAEGSIEEGLSALKAWLENVLSDGSAGAVQV